MPCPKCRSNRLKIKQLSGMERIVAFFTKERSYRCRDCNHGFRAADRRRFSRDLPAAAIPPRPDAH
jgi:hypothetical protein